MGSCQRLHLNRKHSRKIADNGGPVVSGIGRCVHLPAAGAEIYATFVERVDGHGIAQHVDVAVLLRQAFGQRLPLVAAGAAAEYTQLAIWNKVFRVALDGNDIDGFRLVRVHVNHESEIGRQVSADFSPVIARVVRAHHVPVLLHEEDARALRGHGDVMHAVAYLCIWIRDVLRLESTVDRLPRVAAVIGAECARGRDRDEDALRIARIENDGVQAHPTRARLPFGARTMPAQSGEFVPVLSAIGRAEDSRVFHAGVNSVRIGERRLEMPHSFELPGMLCAVIPLVRGERSCGRVINELVALGLGLALGRGDGLAGGCSRLMPGLSALVGALDDLTEPAASLRSVDTIGINRRAFQVVHLPAREVRTTDIPFFALAIRCKNECALACTYKNSYSTHTTLLFLYLFNAIYAT